MRALWQKLWSFVTHMDDKLSRALWVSAALVVFAAAVVLAGRSPMGQAAMLSLEHWMEAYAHSPWAVVIVCLVFSIAALIGAPQFVLIAACVVAFGPWLGFLYSWFATVVSAAMTFYLGRFAGPRIFKVLGQAAQDKVQGFMGQNAFMASLIVRNVPSAPFIVVNMAMGAAGANFWGFLSGCALGVIPKTALVALFGRSLQALEGRDSLLSAAVVVLGTLIWLVLMFVARKLILRLANRQS
jgi:uncharacterized membrane protein YdjX (TVP38/TMEM64 family)